MSELGIRMKDATEFLKRLSSATKEGRLVSAVLDRLSAVLDRLGRVDGFSQV